MKLALALSVVSMAFAMSAKAAWTEQNEIQSVRIHEVTGEELRAFDMNVKGNVAIGAVDCAGADPSALHGMKTLDDSGNPLDPINTVDMIVDKIINIGKKIWQIVAAGKPVVNLKMDVATALPFGARCWTDLESWQVPQSKTYQAIFSNGFNVDVVKLSYRVLWLPGGSVKGVGSYIGYATMAPVDVQVSWGFALNANAAIPTVFNMGTKDAPVGGMQMNMQYQVESPIKTIQQAQAFFVDGRGGFQVLQ